MVRWILLLPFYVSRTETARLQYSNKYVNNISFKSYVRTKTVYKINQECIKKKKKKKKRECFIYSSKKHFPRNSAVPRKILILDKKWWGMNLLIGITWTYTLLRVFVFVLYKLQKCQKKFVVKYYLAEQNARFFKRWKN